MKIVSTHPASQGPFVIIEDADFDPETMELYKEESEAPPAARAGRRSAK